ncbi:MAG TPA: hypothetical protein VFX51_27610 [Solirubrobacteraceae bacterium]|nr:hypothetical protein [Solirubrobacteraceae bacterium]
MFPANAFTIRLAGDDDAEMLRRLAEVDSQNPLSGRILVAVDGDAAVAALSLDENRAVANPFRRTAPALALLRMRASALRGYEQTPSLRERIRVATRVARGTVAPVQA